MKQFLFLILVCYSSVFIAQVPDYYNDVNLSLTGVNLKAALATKITNTHTNNLSYTPGIWEASKITDINPDNSNEVLLIYGYEDGSDTDITNNRVAGINDNGSGSGMWNREHAYSNSLATPDLDDSSENGPPYADAHNLRPCNGQRNSSRGNRKFSDSTGTESGETSESYTNSSGNNQNGWYPGDEWKGDVARMMMYMYLRYGDQTLPTNVGLGDASGTFDDMIDLFLSWNVQDPVSAFELQRNTYHDSNETYAQGNRNPFVDNPYFATQIWGGPLAEDTFGNVTDTENPTSPTNITSSLITGSSFCISWTASTDNAFVTGYKVFLNSVEVGTTSLTNYSVTGLSISTSYIVTIEAYDPSGNTSPTSSSLTINTGADNTVTSDLYISEYIEGSSFNKALEIVNCTGVSVDLSSYTLKKQTNGTDSWSGTPLALSGTLANGDVYVIANASAGSAILDEADLIPSSAVVSFNGNDPIGLFKDDVLIDIIGVFDGGLAMFAENITLQRKFSTTSPASTYDSNEWISLESDTFSRLGSHEVTGTNTFLELISTDWSTAENWSFNDIPGNWDDVIVRANKTIYTSENISLETIILENNASLTISSGGSLIVNGSSAGNITYKRNIANTNWNLVSSPVIGQDIDTFVAIEDLSSVSGSNLGLRDYNNSAASWEYYENGVSVAGDFISGDGRGIQLADPGDISFSGSINTSDVTIGMTSNTNGFNLVGNPYPSYVAGNEKANGTNNILSINAANLIENTLWFWNQEINSYLPINQSSSAFHIAPAQGFFVNALGSENLNITEAMQSHQETDSFLRLTTRREIQLTLTNGSDTRYADIYYIEGATTGWDNGYDSSIFGGIANEFAIYTHAVSNGSGRNLGIQSLPNNDFENIIIPVGVNAESGTNITINTLTSNFPEGMNIYLEDTQNDSFTLLESDTNFNTTLENDLNGIGRFYLHTTSSSLSTRDVGTISNLSIYNPNRENLRIVGVQNGTAIIQLYTILGKEVLSRSFQGNGVNDISLPILTKGVYVVKLATNKGTANKKIIIQ